MHALPTKAQDATMATRVLESSLSFVPGPSIPLYARVVRRWAVVSAPATEPSAGDPSTCVSDLGHLISDAVHPWEPACANATSDTCPSSIGVASRAVHASRSVSAPGRAGSSQLARRARRRRWRETRSWSVACRSAVKVRFSWASYPSIVLISIVFQTSNKCIQAFFRSI